MNTSILKKISLLALISTCSLNGFSQQPDSLTSYLEAAATSNPTVLQRFDEYRAALQKVPQMGGIPNPQLDMGIFFTPMELLSGNQVADIKLMQMFPWFGVLRNAKDEMSLMAEAKFETFRDAKLQVCYDVQRIWYDVYVLRQKISLSEKNVELLKSLERLALAKFQSGTFSGSSSSAGTSMSVGNTPSSTSTGMNSMSGNSGTSVAGKGRPLSTTSMSSPSMSSSVGSSGLASIYRIKIELSDLENEIAALRNEEKVMMARFNSLLNRPLTSAVFVPDTLRTEPLEAGYLLVSDSTFTQNPMLGMLAFEQKSLAARLRMQKQMGLPMIGIGLNYSVIQKSAMSTSTMNGQDMVMPMVSLSLPIYRKKYKAQQAEINFLKTATEQHQQSTLNYLKTAYFEALQSYDDARRRIKLYESQRQLARQSLDISIKTFSSAAIGLTDILIIRQQLLDYERKQVEAVADFNQAKAWIKRLIPNP